MVGRDVHGFQSYPALERVENEHADLLRDAVAEALGNAGRPEQAAQLYMPTAHGGRV